MRMPFGIKITIACAMILLSAPPWAEARWATEQDIKTSVDKSDAKFDVHADGSYEFTALFEQSVLKEEGIERLQVVRMSYDPNLEKMWIEGAKVITNGIESVVA